jgi:hypothetical protein
VAVQAERPDVGEIALASAFHHGHNMVCIPERSPVERPQPPLREKPGTSQTAASADFVVCGYRINAANGADAAIAFESLLAQKARVGSEPPFIDTPFGAKSLASLRHFKVAPPAESPPVVTGRKLGSADPTAGHLPVGGAIVDAQLAATLAVACEAVKA